MTARRHSHLTKKATAVGTCGFLVAATLLLPPAAAPASADRSGRGSVKNSSRSKKSTSSRSTTATRSTTTTRTTTGRAGTTHARPPATRPPAYRPPAGGARAGYRAGYRHGRHASYHSAWHSWRRWRAVTGLFVLGVYAATRPKQSTTVVVTGTTYYYSGGVYFASSGSGYVVVPPPTGAVVYAVPTATTVVYVGTTPYYYYGGTYYVATTAPAEKPPAPEAGTQTVAANDEPESLDDIPMTDDEDQNYEVVSPPAGATVPYLPEEATEERVDGKTYFVYADTYYRAFASDGDTVYQVVEDPKNS